MRVSRPALASLIGVVLMAGTQKGSAQAPQPEPRPFQTEVNYVRVDMYPTLNGKPLAGLAAEDVELLEDGVPQKIEQFEHVSITGPRAQTTRPDPSSMNEQRRAAQDPRARVFVLFLDPRHVDVQGSLRVRRPMIDALNALIGDDDLIAVMTPDMAARGLTFSRRTGSIEQMLTPHWGQENWIGTKDPVEARYDACYGPPIIDGEWMAQQMILRRREGLVLDALDDLVKFLRGLREERKAVITISDGWPLYGPDPKLRKPLLTPTDDPNSFGQVPIPVPVLGTDPKTGRPTTKDPKGSGVTVSSDGRNVTEGTLDRASCEVDRYSLSDIKDDSRFTNIMQAANRSNVSFYPIGPSGFSSSASPLTPRRQSLQTMADMTDGLAVLEPSFLDSGIQRMVDDLSSYYLVGYYSAAKADGRFHKITVRVKRPGVQVRARAGYLAASAAEASSRAATTTVSSPDAAEAQLVTRALNPLAGLGRERPLYVQAAVARNSSGAAVVKVVAEVPRGNARGDDWSRGGQIDATLRTASGELVMTERFALTAGTFVAEFPFTAGAPLAPGDYDVQLRAKGVAVLSPAIDTVRLTLTSDSAGGALFLRRGPGTGNRDVSTADARFRRAERLILETPTLASASGATGRLLDRTGKPLNVPVTATIREGADGSRWRRVEITLAPLAPADYIVESTSGSERTLTGFKVVP